MIEVLFQLGFAVACSIATMAVVFWAIKILPDWLGRRRAMKAAAKKARTEAEAEAEP